MPGLLGATFRRRMMVVFLFQPEVTIPKVQLSLGAMR